VSIHHCVFFKFRGAVPAEERQGIYDQLGDLQDKIDGLESYLYGSNVSFEGMMRGFEAGFIMRFRDRDAHKLYHDHAAHKKAGQRLVDAVEGGIEGIFVFDFDRP